MKNAIATTNYVVLELNEDGLPAGENDSELHVEQYKGEKLEHWKTREDGFHFVFCNRLEIGYWVHPNLVEMETENETN
jgi:hypothetical protein